MFPGIPAVVEALRYPPVPSLALERRKKYLRGFGHCDHEASAGTLPGSQESATTRVASVLGPGSPPKNLSH